MKKEVEIQQENVNTLIKLMKENPTLRVVPMVDTEVVESDGYSCWLGSFGKAEIDECWSDEERIYFKSVDQEDLVDLALDRMGCTLNDSDLEEKEKIAAAEKEVDNYEWEKVIAVSIGTP